MVVCDLDIRIIQDFYKEVVGNLGLNLKKFKRKLSTALHARRVSFDLNGRTSSPLSLRRQGMKQFEVLLGKIRTAEVRDAIASVRAWCGRGMLVLSILIGVAILGVAAVAVVLDSLSKTTDYQLTVLDEMRIQNVIQDAELESLAELRILWDEHEQLAPTPTPAPTPVPTPATVSPANWVEVADCDVEAVAFRIAEGTVTEEWQKKWAAYGDRWEIWAVAPDGSADPSRYRTDIWGNSYVFQISGSTIPLSDLADGYVIVYGEAGRRIGDNDYYQGGAVFLQYPWSCKKLQVKAEDIEWSLAEELAFLAEFSGSRGGHNQFTTRFYLGRELAEEELRALVASDQYDYWFGSGFIGAGTSSGNFNISDAGLLTWGYYYQVSEMDLGVTIPQNQEIVTVTKQRWGEREEEILQRFVWVEVPGDGYHMIEEKNPLVKGGDSLTDSIVLK